MAVEKGGTSIDIMRPREIYCALQQAYSDRKFVGDIAPDGNMDFGDFSVFSGRCSRPTVMRMTVVKALIWTIVAKLTSSISLLCQRIGSKAGSNFGLQIDVRFTSRS